DDCTESAIERRNQDAPSSCDLVYYDDTVKATEGPAANESTDAESLVRQEPGYGIEVAARLHQLTVLAAQVDSLSQKSRSTRVGGLGASKGARRHLHELTSRFADEALALYLRSDRVSELIGQLERERQLLSHAQREMARLGERQAGRVTTLRRELSAIVN